MAGGRAPPQMFDTPEKAAIAPKIVVATTVALSFISIWRAASIVLSDLASTMFYAGGIVEQAVGASAPWFVIAVMLFSYAVRSVYVESCGMFVRGGVYVVVRDSMGPFMARLSVSALVFDYILTGPISAVSAGQYLGRLVNELSEAWAEGPHFEPNSFAVFFGVAVTAYFWWNNVKGIRESSGKALRIMQVTTVMVVILLVWCAITILVRGRLDLPPAPVPENLHFSDHALGWLKGTFWIQVPVVAVIVAFGHSLLSMSGFETLAQVYREIGHPKMKNLKMTGVLVCTYALISTGVITLLAAMIIPDDVRPQYVDNLLGGLAMNLAGSSLLRFSFHIFVVVVGVLILSGAVNTSIIGANGVLNRVAEDGILVDWFRKPHRRFGTTHRIIDLIVLLQISTILASGGDVYLLGEAYAFGVVWSFLLKSLGVLALRFQRHDQEYKAPPNLRIGGREIPVGLGFTVLVLFVVAVANLFSKQTATIYGVTFTAVLFVVFTISERVNRRRFAQIDKGLERFNLDLRPKIDQELVRARAGCILVGVRDYHRLAHLKRILEKTDLRRHDIVVMTVRALTTGAGEYELGENQLFTSYEQELFTKVVELAEKEGKTVELLVVPGVDPFDAMVVTAHNLQASRLVTGVSERMPSEELARLIGLAWERLPEPKHPFSLEVIAPDRRSVYVNLGPHPPRLWPEDVDRLHRLWLRLTADPSIGSKLHHRDLVGLALRRLETDIEGGDREKLIDEIKRQVHD